ncbi:short-chain dehydrogenase [Trichoderma cornu-damae]|uniref:Short-chain dehydrogenase n=1 Tax=Trichoderma cornu-damae TaxID=654480 RepID=A0A9P8TUB5_9HYPO|nr:short-chain dehydrogenase [Trichoderma cornu-damae]
MPGTISFMKQSFPGAPTFTDKNVPDLEGKTIIVTGSNTGLGKEIAQILYSKNAKVYMMARSEDKTNKAIESIKSTVTKSTGELIYLKLDLSDIPSAKASAEEFLRREQKLHLLFNNAGVGYPEKGSKSQQGYELQLGVNCLGTFAFTKALTPALVSTAKTAPANSVRVIWVSSSAAEAIPAKNYVDNLSKLDKMGLFEQYCVSKLGNYWHATEFAARYKADGVISIPLNPGNLDSDFWRTQGALVTCVLRKTLLHPPVYGAYTNLFAAFSPQVTIERSGNFVAPWGKFWNVSKEMIDGSKPKSQGGTGIANNFWEWTEAQIKPYFG